MCICHEQRETIKICAFFSQSVWPLTVFLPGQSFFSHSFLLTLAFSLSLFIFWCSNFGIKLNKREWLVENKMRQTMKNENWLHCLCVWMRFTCVASVQWCFYLFPGNLMSNQNARKKVSVPTKPHRFACLFKLWFSHDWCNQMEMYPPQKTKQRDRKRCMEFNRKCLNLYAQRTGFIQSRLKIEWTFNGTANFLFCQSEQTTRQQNVLLIEKKGKKKLNICVSHEIPRIRHSR